MKLSLISVLLLFSLSSLAQSTNSELLELMSKPVQITSSMKLSQPKNATPAAIFVINRQDIALSGYDTLLDLMSLLPGIEMRKIDNNQWIVSSRSDSGRFNSNVLLMLDGRNLSHFATNGQSWEYLNYPVDDIERIELIRGPSGSLWGNSANNGIINIITRHASDTQGSSVGITAGNNTNYHVNLRHGGYINERMSYRAYFNSNSTNRSQTKFIKQRPIAAYDAKEQTSIGLQLDYTLSDDFTIKSQISHDFSDMQQLSRTVNPVDYSLSATPDDVTYRMSNINLRLDHRLDTNNSYYFQGFVTRSKRHDLLLAVDSNIISLSSAFNHHLEDNLISWGVDLYQSKLKSSLVTNQGNENSSTYGLFVQDEISLSPKLKLIAGWRGDYLKIHGMLHSPNLRATYQLNDKVMFWGAYAQGSRISLSSDEEIYSELIIPSPIDNVQLKFTINNKNTIDKIASLEAGMRYTSDEMDVDFTSFYIDYDNLFVGDEDYSQLFTDAVAYVHLNNTAQGYASGFEIVNTWRINEQLSLLTSASYVNYHLNSLAKQQRVVGSSTYDNLQFFAKLNYQLQPTISLQLLTKYSSDHSSYQTQAYSKVDLAVIWQARHNIALHLVAKNINNSALVEVVKEDELLSGSTAHGRKISLRLQWQF